MASDLAKQGHLGGIQIKTASIHPNLPPNIKTSITTNTLIPATIIEKKPDSMLDKGNWDPVPPLAPLSGGGHTVTIRQGSITATSISTISAPRLDEDSNSTNMSGGSSVFSTNPATPCGDDTENSFAGFEGMLIPGKHEDDSRDGNKQSQVVSSNKMLADLLDKKSSEPPYLTGGDTPNKRKKDGNEGEPVAKRISPAGSEQGGSDTSGKSATSNAANLYAKLAAQLFEGEDMDIEDVEPTPPEPQKSVITVPMQRQIIVSPNNPPQMILAPTPANPPLGQATATIKTESGYQTVPVILQHGNTNPMANIQLQKQMAGMGQQIMQPVMQQQQTQYMLATNQQGQTYLVAQQPQPPMNQILLTQTTQQQGGAPTKTIIILQQQTSGGPQQMQQTIQQSGGHQILGSVNSPGTPQKMIMTNQQGQMIVTQVPRPIQHHVIMNQHPMSTATVVQTNPTLSNSNSIINQVASGTLPLSNPQPQIVSQVQLQQSQSQLSLPLPSAGINPSHMHHQTIQIQKQPVQQNFIQQHGPIQNQISIQQHGPNQQQVSIQQQGQIQTFQTQATIQPIQQQAPMQQQQSLQQSSMQQHQTHQTSIQQQTIQQQQQHNSVQQAPKPIQPPFQIERKTDSPIEKKVFVTGSGNIEMTEVTQPQIQPQTQPSKPPSTPIPASISPKIEEEPWDPNHLWVCDWRGCQG